MNTLEGAGWRRELSRVFAEEVDGVDESVVTLSVSANVEWSETCSVALPLLATVVPIEASLSESDSMINDHAFQGERSRTHAHKFTIRSHLPIIPVYYLSAYYSKNYASIICQPLPAGILVDIALCQLWS